MLTIEAPVEVGNFGFGFVYLVYSLEWNDKVYYDYFYTEAEAQELIDRIGFLDLKVEAIPASLFYFIEPTITLVWRGN